MLGPRLALYPLCHTGWGLQTALYIVYVDPAVLALVERCITLQSSRLPRRSVNRLAPPGPAQASRSLLQPPALALPASAPSLLVREPPERVLHGQRLANLRLKQLPGLRLEEVCPCRAALPQYER